MLVGQIVRLRALESSDYALLHTWLNSPEIMLYWGRPGNTQSLSEVAAEETRNAQRSNSRKYVIETLDDGRAIGQIDFYDLDWVARSAWTSIMIGDENYWSGGYGTDAMRALLRYLFDQLGMHRVSLNVHLSNERAQRSYAKNGFRREGVMRDWMYFEGHWNDGALMSVLEDEFRAVVNGAT